MIALVIAAVLKNFGLLLIAIALVTTVVKVRRNLTPGRSADVAYVLWGELLFYVVGIGYAYTGVLHAYAQDVAAPSIGWQPSPFEYELGWMEIPLAIVAAVSLWRGFEIRLAATIVFVVFALAAAAQHIQQIICCHNYAAGNAGWILWINDIAIPIVVAVCALASAKRRA
jgi:hypothetical protein